MQKPDRGCIKLAFTGIPPYNSTTGGQAGIVLVKATAQSSSGPLHKVRRFLFGQSRDVLYLVESGVGLVSIFRFPNVQGAF
jgi:hypothetical protein